MYTYKPLPTDIVAAYRNGAPDALGNPPEHQVSTGPGNPCRHCLQNIPEGSDMLVLAHKPFAGTHPYSEIGPIFLCASPCDHPDATTTPDILTTSPDYLIKGYCANERIVYGTGAITAAQDISDRLDSIFSNPEVSAIHIRSARNNCYLTKVDRPKTVDH